MIKFFLKLLKSENWHLIQSLYQVFHRYIKILIFHTFLCTHEGNLMIHKAAQFDFKNLILIHFKLYRNLFLLIPL